MLSIDYHVSLKTKTLKKFSLSLWTSFSHLNNGISSNCFYSLLELVYFNLNKFSLAINFELQLVFLHLDLIIISHLSKFKLSDFSDLCRVNLELGLIYFSLSSNSIGFSSCSSVCNGETCRLNTAVLCL